MIDINTSLIIVVIVVWIMFVVVMMFPEIDNNKIEHTGSFVNEQNNYVKMYDKFENEEENEEENEAENEEDEEEDKIEHFIDSNKIIHIGINNDVASVLPIKLEGELYKSQNKEAEHYIQNEPLIHVIDKRTFHDVIMNNHQFQPPIPYTAQNINAFYDFLGSTFDKVNFKYRVNSEGPLI